mmetsp:Transcript_60481/g.128196  ORF Transcript_60481/g.128196 Transcript_60481/m.128196 type:complete len:369 (-) Transcript_60481:612-1718(-)
MGASGSTCSCSGGHRFKAKLVTNLGHHGKKRTRGVSLSGSEDGQSLESILQKRLVKCPDDHTMKGYVVREMFTLCSDEVECDECGEDCGREASCYRCKPCGISYCNDCAREMLGLPSQDDVDVLQVLPGDIFLAGPDRWGIHHVILCTSKWLPVDPEIFEHLHIPPGTELLCCDTIESTQGSVGEETWWYPSTSFFIQDPEDGTTRLLADLAHSSNELCEAVEPVMTKALLHPFRNDQGESTLDEEAFLHVVQERAESSKKYGKLTAVRSVVSGLLQKQVIQASRYENAMRKRHLVRKVKRSWDQRPICASVAIQCWQQYLVQTADSKEEAAENIMAVMPHWCHKSTPSSMVEELTCHGWVVCDSLHK